MNILAQLIRPESNPKEPTYEAIKLHGKKSMVKSGELLQFKSGRGEEWGIVVFLNRDQQSLRIRVLSHAPLTYNLKNCLTTTPIVSESINTSEKTPTQKTPLGKPRLPKRHISLKDLPDRKLRKQISEQTPQTAESVPKKARKTALPKPKEGYPEANDAQVVQPQTGTTKTQPLHPDRQNNSLKT